MWLCGSTGKRDTICHLFFFCYVFSHHPRAGIWERLQALGNIHLNIHLCVFFFFLLFPFFSFCLYLFVICLLLSFSFSYPSFSFLRLELRMFYRQLAIWPHLSLDHHNQPNTQRIALFLAVLVCSTAKRDIHHPRGIGGATRETDLHISYWF